MADKTRYRYVNFIGARILEARELNKLQRIERCVDDNNAPAAYELGATFRDGATLNITPEISGTTVTLTATDGVNPRMVFVRGKWEKLKNAEADPITLSVGETDIYLNWALKKVTLAQDAELKDISSNEATAEMGELVLEVSKTDTSGVALGSDEYEKNTDPIVLWTFTHGSGTITKDSGITADEKGNVHAFAVASDDTAGPVYLTTGTADGQAVADDDPRMTDARTPLDASVTNVKVRTPVGTGNTNADGTPEFVIGADPGGISSVKVVLLAAKQTLEAGWNWLLAAYNQLRSDFDDHKILALGTVNSHPMPTYVDVGAAPAAHVDMQLGVDGSHPATVTANTGGFVVDRDPAVTPLANDYSYSTVASGQPKNGFLHDGDVYSITGATRTIPASDGDGSLTVTGAASKWSVMAGALAEHINKTSHKNPHGLAPEDIGAATVSYVDTADANILSSAIAFAELMGQVNVRKVVTLAATTDTTVWPVAFGFVSVPSVNQAITRYFEWVVVTFANRYELAFGFGCLKDGSSIPMPAADTYGSWPANNMIASAGLATQLDKNDLDSPSWACNVGYAPPSSDGSGGLKSGTVYAKWKSAYGTYQCYANVQAITWRVLTQPPVLISLSPSSGPAATSLTISGRNFGSVVGNATVLIGGVSAAVSTCNPTEIVCTVPAGAAGAQTVEVQIAGPQNRPSINQLTFTRT